MVHYPVLPCRHQSPNPAAVWKRQTRRPLRRSRPASVLYSHRWRTELPDSGPTSAPVMSYLRSRLPYGCLQNDTGMKLKVEPYMPSSTVAAVSHQSAAGHTSSRPDCRPTVVFTSCQVCTLFQKLRSTNAFWWLTARVNNIIRVVTTWKWCSGELNLSPLNHWQHQHSNQHIAQF